MNNKEIRKGCKDVFHSFLVKGAKFDGKYEIPFVPQEYDQVVPKNLVSYEIICKHNFNIGDCVHFYIDDYKFDGKFGVWNSLKEGDNKRGFSLERIKNAEYIICPDYSLYLDMPLAMQIWNVYRSRAVGYYLSQKGYKIIPNIRWTSKESFSFAFKGVSKNKIVAVGTLGCAKTLKDRAMFVNGFIEMYKRLQPKTIIIYGSIFKELNIIIKKYNIKYVNFQSDISKFYEGYKHGSKSK